MLFFVKEEGCIGIEAQLRLQFDGVFAKEAERGLVGGLCLILGHSYSHSSMIDSPLLLLHPIVISQRCLCLPDPYILSTIDLYACVLQILRVFIPLIT